MTKVNLTANTISEIFIIESLSIENENDGKTDGKLLFEILKFYGKNPKYFYLRTTEELEEILEIYFTSQYRYLFLSCHGDNNSLGLTFNLLTYEEFAKLTAGKLNNRRLFVSACELGNENFARAIFDENRGIFSIIAPINNVSFDSMLPFWSSYFHLSLQEENKMTSSQIKPLLMNLTSIFQDTSISYFYNDTVNKKIVHWQSCNSKFLS
ncbi:hypothetical protein LVJ85_13260 [Neisseria sp. Dent CA1/247]|uniref:hypothetical protein n=1 Tax=Neisseria sp. Dent CA1/247 TaxID=2912675 RepID=UPI001FD39E66|nr:hypothetical protein [Neisseria sp. Dent CA1/247]UOO76936.1 hypothetical protein LVJ85_13260 [Neisseria sp. Dent CA1/247]